MRILKLAPWLGCSSAQSKTHSPRGSSLPFKSLSLAGPQKHRRSIYTNKWVLLPTKGEKGKRQIRKMIAPEIICRNIEWFFRGKEISFKTVQLLRLKNNCKWNDPTPHSNNGADIVMVRAEIQKKTPSQEVKPESDAPDAMSGPPQQWRNCSPKRWPSARVNGRDIGGPGPKGRSEPSAGGPPPMGTQTARSSRGPPSWERAPF